MQIRHNDKNPLEGRRFFVSRFQIPYLPVARWGNERRLTHRAVSTGPCCNPGPGGLWSLNPGPGGLFSITFQMDTQRAPTMVFTIVDSETWGHALNSFQAASLRP